MSEFFQHGFNVLGHGLIGYIVPFLFVLTIVVSSTNSVIS